MGRTHRTRTIWLGISLVMLVACTAASHVDVARVVPPGQVSPPVAWVPPAAAPPVARAVVGGTPQSSARVERTAAARGNVAGSWITEEKTIDVRAEYTEPVPSVDGVQCRGLAAAAPDCRLVVVGPIPFTGTIEGMAYTETSGPTPDGDHYEGPDSFADARIDGCGEGGFVLDTDDGDLGVARYDPSTNTMPGYNTWTLRRGSGTGGLSGLISGTGENHWTMYWSDAAGDRWGRGVFTGTITCRVTRWVAGRSDQT